MPVVVCHGVRVVCRAQYRFTLRARRPSLDYNLSLEDELHLCIVQLILVRLTIVTPVDATA